MPRFTKDSVIHRTFLDGSLIHSMDILGPFILLRVYLDAFASNNPLGSSSDKDKILGMYITPIITLDLGSSRKTIQTLALVDQNDIDFFGHKKCLEHPMQELKELVCNGIYDEVMQRNIQVRIICCLGDSTVLEFNA